MLDFVSESVRSAGPLIIFGSFVLGCINHIFPSSEELNKTANKNQWDQDRIDWEIKFLDFAKWNIFRLVIIGVCFGLYYAWVNQIWSLCTSLAFMSVVALILLFYVIQNPIRGIFQYRVKAKIAIVKKQHPLPPALPPTPPTTHDHNI